MNESVLRTVPGEDASGLSWLAEVLLEHLWFHTTAQKQTVNIVLLIQHHP